jgi:orotidine-5'-phosphate decarboxylase
VNGTNFADRLLEAIEKKRSHVVVGFDPDYELLPPEVRAAYPREACGSDAEMMVDCFRGFLTGVLEAVCADAVAIKMQCAYFEALGAPGYRLYEELVGPIRQSGCLVIGDVKRGDIGSTAEAYARAQLEVAGVDAVTVNPYLGSDSVEPFARRARETGKGVFVLVKTSNPSSAEIQDLGTEGDIPLYRRVAGLVTAWGRGSEGRHGYCSVGAVVGGTHPSQGMELRACMPGVPFLVPGYGAQGAGADDIAGMFDANGTGAVVNSSRAVLYAYRNRGDMDWRKAARSEVKEMRTALWRASGRG